MQPSVERNLPEVNQSELCPQSLTLQRGLVTCSASARGCCQWVINRLIRRIDPFEGSELEGLEGTPRSATVNEFSLIKAADGLGQGVVVGIH